MNKTKHIKIEGVSEALRLADQELQFIRSMVQNRRSDFLFHIGPYQVRVEDTLRKVDWGGDIS